MALNRNMSSCDFDFDLGKGRRLRGFGWRGLVALGLLVLPFIIAILVGLSGMRVLWNLGAL